MNRTRFFNMLRFARRLKRYLPAMDRDMRKEMVFCYFVGWNDAIRAVSVMIEPEDLEETP